MIRPLLTFILLLTYYTTTAQLNSFDHYFKSISDASKFLNGYFGPFGLAFSNGLSNNWYQSARCHRWGTISGHIGLSYIHVPDRDRIFSIPEQQFQTLKDVGNDPYFPTIFGPKNLDNAVEYYSTDAQGNYKKINTFKGVKGSGVGFLLVPALQLNVGLPINTSLHFRYVPPLGFTGNNVYATVTLWGIGLQHEISRDFKKWFQLPVDISFQAGYSQVNTNVHLNIQPPAPDSNVILTGANYDDQLFILNSKAYTANLIVSRDLKKLWKPLSVYAGAGYNTQFYRMRLLGNYPLPTPRKAPPYEGKILVTDYKDPLDIDIESKGNFRFTLGARLQFKYIYTYLDITRAGYYSVSTGVGLRFQQLWGKVAKED